MAEVREWLAHKGDLIDTIADFEVIECETCGFKHIVPLPRQSHLNDIYRDKYYATEKPVYLKGARSDLEWCNQLYGEQYDVFEHHLGEGSRRILDVGSGPGYFLLHGKNRGWDVQGIEPSQQAVEHSRSLGLTITETFFDDKTVAQFGKYDVVHFSQVLEHVVNPIQMVEMARNLLNSDGLLSVVVPNDYNAFQQALILECGFEHWWVMPPHHINYFDFDSLAGLFDKCGFEVVFKQASFPIDMFLLMGDDYKKDRSLGAKCHEKRKRFESNLERAGMQEIKQKLYQAMADIGIGREAILIGKKRPLPEAERG